MSQQGHRFRMKASKDLSLLLECRNERIGKTIDDSSHQMSKGMFQRRNLQNISIRSITINKNKK